MHVSARFVAVQRFATDWSGRSFMVKMIHRLRSCSEQIHLPARSCTDRVTPCHWCGEPCLSAWLAMVEQHPLWMTVLGSLQDCSQPIKEQTRGATLGGRSGANLIDLNSLSRVDSLTHGLSTSALSHGFGFRYFRGPHRFSPWFQTLLAKSP